MRVKQPVRDTAYMFEYLCALLRRLNITELEELIKLINSSVYSDNIKLTYNARSHSVSVTKNQVAVAILTKSGVAPVGSKINIA